MAVNSDAEGDDNVLLSNLSDNRSATDSSLLSSGTPTDVLEDKEVFESDVSTETISKAVNLQQNGVNSQAPSEDNDTSESCNYSSMRCLTE